MAHRAGRLSGVLPVVRGRRSLNLDPAPRAEAAGVSAWARTPALPGAVALLLLCLGRMSVSTFQPFLYFRF